MKTTIRPAKPRKRLKIALICGAVLLISAIICFFNSQLGYFSTIRWRNFAEIQPRVYLDQSTEIGQAEFAAILETALARVTAFWGALESQPTYVISSNPATLAQMGWSGSPALARTYVIRGATTYIVISSEGLDVDVLAHEISHAELHHRLYAGKWFSTSLAPVWFDEGLALQNDYRSRYDTQAWVKATGNGRNMTDFAKLATTAAFFDPDIEVRRYNYIVSKHYVAEWLAENGREGLLQLLERIRQGETFNACFSPPTP